VVQERTREAQRLEKLLEDAGIKLSSVASDTLGVSGRLMLAALTQDAHDPQVLADLAKGQLRKKLPALREALEGRFGEPCGVPGRPPGAVAVGALRRNVVVPRSVTRTSYPLTPRGPIVTSPNRKPQPTSSDSTRQRAQVASRDARLHRVGAAVPGQRTGRGGRR
jgi:hypothetical protein